MATESCNELGALADEQLDAISGGGYVHLHPTGFGVQTDNRLAQKQRLESNFRGVLVVPTLP
jgi:hypothetical protein